jgi:outer membrane protein OmpA-like peptidoglycan-associated protein
MLTKAQATNFKEEQLQAIEPTNVTGRSGRQMNVYHNKLNILGDRMRTNPDATVTLVGASAQGPEDGRALAESIKRYLVDVFGIDGGRITTEGRDKPKTPSEQPGNTLELKLLRAEDRRVDIETQSPNLLLESGGPPDMMKPVQIAAVQEDPLDSHVIFYVTGAKELLSSWSLEITDELGNVQRYGPSTREWESIPGNTILGNRTEGEYKIVMLGQTRSGHEVRKEGPVINLVRLDEPKPEGLRFSILFRFDRSDMIALYEKFLTEKVAPLIPDSGVVIIHGHTDIIGDEEYNNSLSNNRAWDVQRVIERATSNAGKLGVTFESYGFGSDIRFAPFENNLPEERFYNRTVIIDIVPAI